MNQGLITPFPYFGEAMAVFNGLIWAVAVIQFRLVGATVHPLALNFFKTTLASLLLIPSIWIFDLEGLWALSQSHFWILAISGIVGTTLADTFYFSSLNRLGAGLTAICCTLYSPFVIVLSMFFLSESLSFWQVMGVVLVLSAVILITRTPSFKFDGSRRLLLSGILFAATACLCTAVSIVMIKPLLTDESVSLVLATGIRVFSGSIGIYLAALLDKKRGSLLKTLKDCQNKGTLVSGSILGGYLAIVTWLVGMKYADASVSAVLNQMSTVFIFLLGIIFLKEPLSKTRLFAVALAILGAVLVSVS